MILKAHLFPRLDNAQQWRWRYGLFLFCSACSLFGLTEAHAQTAPPAATRPHYRIEIDLDDQAASFTGREVVRLVNNTREEWDSLTFHLYPNAGLAEDENQLLTVKNVRQAQRELRFSLRGRGAVLRIELPSKLLPQQSLELTIDFAAQLPRVQQEETSLLAHFLQELSDAVSEDRQPRDTRDIFMASDEALLLGYFFPMLAVNQLQIGEQGLVAGASSIVCSEVADYDVTATVADGLLLVGSGVAGETKLLKGPKPPRRSFSFRGEKLRGFALVAGKNLKVTERRVGDLRLASIYREGDERLAQRALEIAARAVEVFQTAFGPYPYKQLQIIELPLPAGYSGIEFPGVVALAQAYYLDFDAPQAQRLPGIVREQADVIKAAFEFTLAHGIAHQWWGGAVGSDAQRAPYLDEALAVWSAAYYHEAAYGQALGQSVLEQQLRGSYQLYRLLGGADLEADKPAKEFRNSLQYTAIAQAKGALLLHALRGELGDERFFHALRSYYTAYQFQLAQPELLRLSFSAAASDARIVRLLFQRWLREKHGDEDIGLPDVGALTQPSSKMRALGRVLVRIGRTAARPF